MKRDAPSFKTNHYISDITKRYNKHNSTLNVLKQFANEDEYPSGIMAVGAKGHCRVVNAYQKYSRWIRVFSVILLTMTILMPKIFHTDSSEILKQSIIMPMTTEQWQGI